MPEVTSLTACSCLCAVAEELDLERGELTLTAEEWLERSLWRPARVEPSQNADEETSSENSEEIRATDRLDELRDGVVILNNEAPEDFRNQCVTVMNSRFEVAPTEQEHCEILAAGIPLGATLYQSAGKIIIVKCLGAIGRIGAGRALLRSLEGVGRERGCEIMLVRSILDPDTVAFYHAMGFRASTEVDAAELDRFPAVLSWLRKSDYLCRMFRKIPAGVQEDSPSESDGSDGTPVHGLATTALVGALQLAREHD